MRSRGESVKTTARPFCTIKLRTARGFVPNESTLRAAGQAAFYRRFSGKTNSNEKKEWRPIHRTLRFRQAEDIIGIGRYKRTSEYLFICGPFRTPTRSVARRASFYANQESGYRLTPFSQSPCTASRNETGRIPRTDLAPLSTVVTNKTDAMDLPPQKQLLTFGVHLGAVQPVRLLALRSWAPRVDGCLGPGSSHCAPIRPRARFRRCRATVRRSAMAKGPLSHIMEQVACYPGRAAVKLKLVGQPSEFFRINQ